MALDDAAGWGCVDELPVVDLAYADVLLSTMIFKGIAFFNLFLTRDLAVGDAVRRLLLILQ